MLLFLLKPVKTKREFLGRPHIFIDCLNTNNMVHPRDCLKATMQKIVMATVEFRRENTE